MTDPADVVFLIDCDNTLLDNDRVLADLREHLTREFGAASAGRYWAIFERLRDELGYADYLGALQRYRMDDERDPRLLMMSSYLVDYPFADRLYPGALDVLAHLRTRGPTVILSDTVCPRQGHYALDPHTPARYPAAGVSVERIGDLLGHALRALSGATTPGTR